MSGMVKVKYIIIPEQKRKKRAQKKYMKKEGIFPYLLDGKDRATRLFRDIIEEQLYNTSKEILEIRI